MILRTVAVCTFLLILTAANLADWKTKRQIKPRVIQTNSASNSIKHPAHNQTINDFDLTDPSGNDFPFT